ncbi:MAG: PD-(D/E)XK nuclease-like domain-containing protein [Endozoicomonas sp.]
MKPGIYDNLPEMHYHGGEGLSASTLVEMGRSPAHCKAKLDGLRDKRTRALEIGTALHCAVLEPERFQSAYTLAPNPLDEQYADVVPVADTHLKAHCKKLGIAGYSKLKKDELKKAILEVAPDTRFWDQIIAEVESRSIILSENDMDLCQGVMASVSSHSKASKAFSKGVAERSIYWQDEATGLLCRGRMDYYREDLGIVFDLKSCVDARYDKFQKDIPKYHYHQKASWYLDGCRALGLPANGFAWLAIEKEAPYAIGLYMASKEMLAQGRTEMEVMKLQFAECQASGIWSAYTDEFTTIELPPWAMDAQPEGFLSQQGTA